METPEEYNPDPADQVSNSKRPVGCLVMGVICLCVFLAGIIGAGVLIKMTPEAEKETPEEVLPIVRVITAKRTDEQLYVKTQGQVVPLSRTQAAAEVMGRVTKVSPQFKTGGVFAAGDIMLELDRSDYVAALARTEATLADAKLLLAQEEARADQAMRDWKKLGKGEAPELVARKPQIASATARVASAQAEVERAIRDLDRTKLRAPYACRVEAIFTDLGSYVAPGARLADLYSVDELELRLPVPLEDFAYLTEQANEKSGAIVHAHARLGGADRKWVANISRSEGQVDRNTMMVHLVARLKPNKKDKAFPLPPVGLFMQGRIEGKMIKGVFSIPRSALRHDNTILVLKKDNTLAVKTVELARTLDTTVLISGGLEEGEQIITSPLETPVPGMKLTTVEKAAEKNSEESNK